MQLFNGDKVHIDTDNDEWGRVATDGRVIRNFTDTREALIQADSIRANIIVPWTDIRVIGGKATP